jgi:hypothetical protein
MELWEKSETIPPDVRAHIESLVTALGGRSTYDDSYCKRIAKYILGALADQV